jgi:hypothetical protein
MGWVAPLKPDRHGDQKTDLLALKAFNWVTTTEQEAQSSASKQIIGRNGSNGPQQFKAVNVNDDVDVRASQNISTTPPAGKLN